MYKMCTCDVHSALSGVPFTYCTTGLRAPGSWLLSRAAGGPPAAAKAPHSGASRGGTRGALERGEVEVRNGCKKNVSPEAFSVAPSHWRWRIRPVEDDQRTFGIEECQIGLGSRERSLARNRPTFMPLHQIQGFDYGARSLRASNPTCSHFVVNITIRGEKNARRARRANLLNTLLRDSAYSHWELYY